MCSLEPSQHCENFFGVIVLQFVSRPPRGYKIWFIIIVPLLLFVCVCVASPLSSDVECLFLVGSSVFLSKVVQRLIAILVLWQEKMSARPSTLYLEPILDPVLRFE